MCKLHTTSFLTGLVLALVLTAECFAQSPSSRPKAECATTTPILQEVTLVDLELVTRAEERIESLRAKLVDLEVKEMSLQAGLDDLDYRMTPEGIQRALVFVGSARPMDEFREALRLRLEGQKERLNKQLELITTNRERLEGVISEAEAELETLRKRLEERRQAEK